MQDTAAVQRHKRCTRTDAMRFGWQYCLLIVWAVWWGGLCFYAIVVVPIGTEVIGAVEQGFNTQQVTRWQKRVIVCVSRLLVG